MASKSEDISKIRDEVIDHVEQCHDDPRRYSIGTDKAAEMLREKGRTVVLTLESNKKVLRKIDTRILPVILAIYFLQALDKVCQYCRGFDPADREGHSRIRLGFRSC